MCRNIHDLAEEEYKQIFGLASQIEHRMLQIFGVSVAVSVSLLSAIGGLIFTGRGTQANGTIGLYLILIPNLFTIPSFSLILSHRIDLVRVAAYQKVFFENEEINVGWVTRLIKFRTHVKHESHDPIPLTYWAIMLISSAVFVFVTITSGLSYFHFISVPILILALWRIHASWRRVIPHMLQEYVDIWQKVKCSTSEEEITKE